MLDRLRPIWPLLTLLVSGGLLAGAHAFETFGGLRPCPMCLDQRNWHWGVVVVSALMFIVARVRPEWSRLAVLACGLALAGATYMALYHVAVEQHWVPATCDARINLNNIKPWSLDGEVEAPHCDEIAWSMFGISMAGYNAIVSGLAALTTFFVALAPARKA
ncbi:disulfide bond formation protein B [Terricaulis sp.]|uniref:disulfide bond formation protein B n=1 Tax=Terricaulis sp. TaxID=2768686 RepID=UPI0037839946